MNISGRVAKKEKYTYPALDTPMSISRHSRTMRDGVVGRSIVIIEVHTTLTYDHNCDDFHAGEIIFHLAVDS